VTTQTDNWIALFGRWPSASEEFVDGEADVAGDLPEQRRRYVSTGVKRHCCTPAVSMSELLVGAALTGLDEAAPFEQRDDLARLQDGDGPHA
jgi:hypothetical protein